MDAFLKFFYEFIMTLLGHIGDFFVDLWNNFWNIFNFKEYFRIFEAYRNDFNVLAWILAILSIIFIVALFGFLIYLIVVLVRRYLRFRKSVITQEETMEEIADLNSRVMELIDEKNNLMALKVSQLGLRPGAEEDETENGEKKVVSDSRFVKLRNVDARYVLHPFIPRIQEEISLSFFAEAFRNFACSQLKLFYDIDIIRLFLAGMGTSRILILEGISGTGKTSLPYAFGKFLQYDTSIIAVQPSWRDKSELIGYFNEFTKRFNETDFLRSLYEATYRNDVGFIVLDEMNLARIEYYFAEILSVLEMPSRDEWVIDVVPDTWETDPIHLKNGKLKFPPNVWFVGTANNDDSTFTITDKVYDRAVAISINNKGVEFKAPDQYPISMDVNYLESMFAKAKEEYPLSSEMIAKINELDDYVIVNFRLAFGNRILKQMKSFVPVYIAAGGTELGAMDYLLRYKIFRKFEVLNISFAQDNLKKLLVMLDKLFGKNTLPSVHQYINDLMKR